MLGKEKESAASAVFEDIIKVGNTLRGIYSLGHDSPEQRDYDK